MKKLLLLLFILTSVILAQDSPSSYTSHLGLRLYADGANPGADSLNQNMTDIDSLFEAHSDTLSVIKTDLYTSIMYDGTIRDGSVAWADLSSAAKTNIVQTTGTQNIGGSKTFTSPVTFSQVATANSTIISKNIIPPAGGNELYRLGFFNGLRYKELYVKDVYLNNLYVLDPVDTTSYGGITYSETECFETTKKWKVDSILVSASFEMDSAASIPSLKLEETTYSIGDVKDTVITLTSLASNVRVNPPGDVDNIDTITMTNVSIGHILDLYSTDVIDTVTFIDGSDNLQLSGDFAMAQYDHLKLKYIYDGNALSFYWIEVSRSDN